MTVKVTVSARSSERGVALIAVLWLVAAMGLIITGVVQSVRSEVRTVGLQRQTLVASASADAAILMALQNLQALKIEPRAAIQSVPVLFEGTAHEVRVVPLNGLIDVNRASVALLADLYRYGGELAPDAAQSLAQATLEWRQLKNVKGREQGFDAREDLLRVPQMTYDLYAKVAGLVTADLKEGSGRVNALAAPSGVLRILTGGDVARAAALESRRNADPVAMDITLLKPEHIEMASSRSLRFQVQIDLPGGGAAVRAWHVYWGVDPRSGLPWRVLATQQSLLPVI